MSKSWQTAARIGGVLLAATAIALGAWLAVPLPFSPVPVTAQTLAVLLAGGFLGSSHGALAVVVYLVAGVIGLPVFADGTAGFQHLTGPTGGFLIGFLAGAFVAGGPRKRARHGENRWRSFGRVLAIMLLAHAAIFGVGVPWLAQIIGWQAAWSKGFLPFLPGAVVKSLAAALIMHWRA